MKNEDWQNVFIKGFAPCDKGKPRGTCIHLLDFFHDLRIPSFTRVKSKTRRGKTTSLRRLGKRPTKKMRQVNAINPLLGRKYRMFFVESSHSLQFFIIVEYGTHNFFSALVNCSCSFWTFVASPFTLFLQLSEWMEKYSTHEFQLEVELKVEPVKQERRVRP